MHALLLSQSPGKVVSRAQLFAKNSVSQISRLSSSEVASRDALPVLPPGYGDVPFHLQHHSKAPSKVAVVAAPASHDPIQMHAIKAERRPSCRSARSTFHLRT